MNNKRRIVYWIVLAPVIAAFCMAGAASDKNADNAKLYQKSLETMVGQSSGYVLPQLEKWEFRTLESYGAENPTWKDISKHNRAKVKFSKDDYNQLFAQGGNFKVLVYNKLIGTDTSHIGEIDGSGRGIMKDANINLQQYTVIRLVFKDDKLIQCRVWPKLDQSGFSGGTWLRR
ncbi:MAG: hypothetical protein ABSG19_01710 [Candidatus Aminicenantales bacterium]